MLILSIAALMFQAQAADAAAQADAPAKKVRFRGNPGRWFGRDNYPAAAVAARKEGLVAMILRVDEQGGVSDCRIVQSSGFDPLDQGTCDLVIKHVAFHPPKDSAGQPVASDYPLKVTWYLDARSPITSRAAASGRR